MSYNTVEVIGGGVLALAPPAALLSAGILIVRRPSRRAVQGFWLCGVLAFLAVPVLGVLLPASVFPPPSDPAFASGRGLDLRGAGFVAGGVAGGVASLVVTYTVGVVLIVIRARRAARRTTTAK